MTQPPRPSNEKRRGPSPSPFDQFLRQKLENAVAQYFYRGCPAKLHELLGRCNWYVTTKQGFLMLVIHCPDATTNWQVLDKVGSIGYQLKAFTESARIRIMPPEGSGTYFDIRVDELSTYDIP